MAVFRARSVRPAAVAGSFYPADPEALTAQIEALLGEPGPGAKVEPLRLPRALIAPHAGYVYSGSIAASAYRVLGRTGGASRIALLGPSHHQGFRGVAVPEAAAFATPLGAVGIHAQALAELRDLSCVSRSDAPHAREHSLEVQLPFLQHLCGEVHIIPIVTGSASAIEIEAVIDAIWDERTLIVVSSDLSHYHAYGAARRFDETTVRSVLAAQENLSGEQACGFVALNGLMRAARKRGLTAELLDLRNSGDTCGERRSVVGYGAFAFYAA